MINPVYSPAPNRYESGIHYRRCGHSGILLPEISLGFWHNFGDVNPLRMRFPQRNALSMSSRAASPGTFFNCGNVSIFASLCQSVVYREKSAHPSCGTR